MATLTSQADYAKTALRLPRDLHQQIHDAARAADRSFNSEIVQRLKSSFPEAALKALKKK